MGGAGSGRWQCHTKKKTVESCACLAALPGGKITGTMPPGTWHMEIMEDGGAVFLVLRGERQGWQGEEQIRLQFWQPPMGGKAIWMLCPGCGRKCRKLFSPPGMARYRCARCWELAYTSSQEAHHWDRGAAAGVMAQVAMNMGCSLRDVAQVMKNGEKLNRWRR
jgi:hypothetical protein